MKKFIDFLNRANTILIFLTFCLLVVFVLVQTASSFWNSFQKQGVQLVESSSDLEKGIVERPTVSQARLVRDYYFFDLNQSKIAKNSSSNYRAKGLYSPTRDSVVNIYYVKDNESNGKLLFKTNCLVTQEYFADEKIGEDKVLCKNAFLVVLTDTNNNGFLDYEDSKSLYISEYDGSMLHEVMTNVKSLTFPRSDNILIEKEDIKQTLYFELNLRSGKINELLNTSNISTN